MRLLQQIRQLWKGRRHPKIRTSASLGKLGEELALEALKKNRYRILEQNYRCPWGEIDLIARDGNTLVFVEVKTRSSSLFGSPLHSVGRSKQRKLVKSAMNYLNAHGLHHSDCRFDVVSVMIDPDRHKNHVEVIEDAFDADI